MKRDLSNQNIVICSLGGRFLSLAQGEFSCVFACLMPFLETILVFCGQASNTPPLQLSFPLPFRVLHICLLELIKHG